jgi:hypothetical protein
VKRVVCVPLACRQWEVGTRPDERFGPDPKLLRGEVGMFDNVCFEITPAPLRTGRMPVVHGGGKWVHGGVQGSGLTTKLLWDDV